MEFAQYEGSKVHDRSGQPDMTYLVCGDWCHLDGLRRSRLTRYCTHGQSPFGTVRFLTGLIDAIGLAAERLDMLSDEAARRRTL